MTTHDTALRHVRSPLATPEQRRAAARVLAETRQPTDAEMIAIDMPQRYRLAPVTAWRQWITARLCDGTLALVFVAGWVAGILSVVAVLL